MPPVARSRKVCISIQRVCAYEAIRDEFSTRTVEATAKLKIGRPKEETTDVSSLITETEAKRIETWIGKAQQGGAALLTAGRVSTSAVSILMKFLLFESTKWPPAASSYQAPGAKAPAMPSKK